MQDFSCPPTKKAPPEAGLLSKRCGFSSRWLTLNARGRGLALVDGIADAVGIMSTAQSLRPVTGSTTLTTHSCAGAGAETALDRKNSGICRPTVNAIVDQEVLIRHRLVVELQPRARPRCARAEAMPGQREEQAATNATAEVAYGRRRPRLPGPAPAPPSTKGELGRHLDAGAGGPVVVHEGRAKSAVW